MTLPNGWHVFCEWLRTHTAEDPSAVMPMYILRGSFKAYSGLSPTAYEFMALARQAGYQTRSYNNPITGNYMREVLGLVLTDRSA